MKNRFPRGIILLTAALLAGPAAVQGQFSYAPNADGLTATITGYSGSGGAVAIPDTISNLTVTRIGPNAFYARTNMTSVTIPGTVTTISPEAFEFCTSLVSVTIPASVTYIGAYSYAGCSNLTNITIPASVTNIGDAAFGAILTVIATGVSAQCASLTAINVDAQNSFYSSSNGVLFDKSLSTLLQFPGGVSGGYTIPGSVTSIEWQAFCATPLTSVTIPGSVTNFGYYAFGYCASLTNALIAKGATSIGNTPASCSRIAPI